MPEWLTEWFAANPSYAYASVAVLFVLCGLGLPLPEEIILVSAGYLCYQGEADYWLMTLVCGGAILLGDVIPFLLGSFFGPRLLRLRWLRFVINRQRLATFNRWFRRRGDMVILIARFIPGLRVVAFFTGGTMRMRWPRFLFLDTCGITLTAPTFVFVGYHFGEKIHEAFRWVQHFEGALLYGASTAGAVLSLWYWLRQRARRRVAAGPKETFVEPSRATAPETGGETPAKTPGSSTEPPPGPTTHAAPRVDAEDAPSPQAEPTGRDEAGATREHPRPERRPGGLEEAREYPGIPLETDDPDPDPTEGRADATDRE